MLKLADRIGSCGRAVVVAATLGLAAASAAAQTTISFSPVGGHIPCTGGTLGVDVMIGPGAADLRAASLVIAFDKNVIRPVSVTAGPALAAIACPAFTYWNGVTDADSVAVDLAGLGCSVTGAGSLVTIVFQNHAEGETALTLRRGLLRDSQNEPISFAASSGTVHVECAVGDESASWGAIKSLYR